MGNSVFKSLPDQSITIIVVTLTVIILSICLKKIWKSNSSTSNKKNCAVPSTTTGDKETIEKTKLQTTSSTSNKINCAVPSTTTGNKETIEKTKLQSTSAASNKINCAVPSTTTGDKETIEKTKLQSTSSTSKKINCAVPSTTTGNKETIEKKQLRSTSSTSNTNNCAGKHENHILEGEEINLHKNWTNCQTNPGHPEFIPIESFSLKHLPEGHQDSDLYEFIKATADLTVRLSVYMTSPDRPEFWPNTKIPYFLSELRGKKTLRTGTGQVWRVSNYTDEHKQSDYTTCPCDKCKASDQPSKVWWKICVLTAANVVVDDIEGSHTTLRFFYDSEGSPLVFLKNKIRVDKVNIEEDWCLFTCVTCDKNLGNKLEKMWEHFDDVWLKVWNKYFKSRDIDKFNFLVSHPHGCSKHVSVGQWKDKVQVGRRKWQHKFTYTTCTCPGSSGATVHCVGYYGVNWHPGHVHSRSLESGLNVSGVGFLL